MGEYTYDLAVMRERAARKARVQQVRIGQAYYNFDLEVWAVAAAKLPINPYNNKPVLLVPKAYIRELPTINTIGFWDYCMNLESEALRNDFNRDVAGSEGRVDCFHQQRFVAPGQLQNTEDFPQSGNAWDSLAEAYMDNGDKGRAIQYYQKSLELNPANDNARQMIKKLADQHN